MNDPVDHIEWLDSSLIKLSGWNPNAVLSPQMRALEKSILDLGWVFPILVSKDRLCIDGHHRLFVAQKSKALQERYGQVVPCSILDIDEPQAIITMIRLGRARGTHVAIRVSELVQRLVNVHGMTEEAIQQALEAPKEEIALLLAGSLLKTRNLKEYQYSKAWRPIETKKEQPVEQFERSED